MDTKKLIITSIVAGVIVYLLIGFGVGLPNILSAMHKVNYFYLLLSAITYGFSLLAITLRWREITKEAKIKVSLKKLYLMTLSGVAFNNITPSSRMGGEPVRAYFLNQHSKTKMKESFATIVSSRIFDAIIFTLISIIVLSYSIINLKLPSFINLLLLLSLISSIIIIMLIVYVSVKPRAAKKMSLWFIKKFKRFSKTLQEKGFEAKMNKEIEEYSRNVNKFLKTTKLWVNCSVFTLLVWVFDVTRMYFIFLGIGMHVNPAMLLMVLVLSGLAGAIPLFPGGIAVTESTMILVYNSFKIPLATAGLVTILDRLVYFWLFSVLGLIASYKLGIKKYEKYEKKHNKKEYD